MLTSEDGVLARLAAAEAQALVDSPVRFLAGGNAAWQAAGYPLSAEPNRWPTRRSISGASPTNARGDTKAAMNEYLAWEIDLLPRVERDGSLKFSVH